MHNIRLMYLVWIICLIVVTGIIFVQRQDAPIFYGIAETREIIINTESPVEIKRLQVAPGQEVYQGDLLVQFEQPELTMKINEITHELEELKTRHQISTAETSSRIDQLTAQKASKMSEIRGRIKQLQAQYDINKDITSRLKSIEHDTSLEDRAGVCSPVKIRIESLERELDLALNEIQIKIDLLSRELESPESPEKIGIERLERELNILLAERNKLYISAPVSGIVGSVNVKEGETVSPFTPVLTVHTKSPSYVKGFIHENVHNRISLGSAAEIVSLADSDKRVMGTVIGVGSRIIEFPARLRRRPQMQLWGREVLIQIPADNGLLLGEKVMVMSFEEDGDSYWSTVTKSLSLKDSQAKVLDTIKPAEWKRSPLMPITVAQPLPGALSIEASGAVYLADLQKYVIISDSTAENRPLLYLMDDKGRIDEEIAVHGLKRIDDMEAITTDERGNVYLACSQSPKKDGSLPEARKLLVRVKRDRTVLTLDKELVLYDALEEAARLVPDSLWASLLTSRKGRLDLEVEGMVVWDGSLLLGIKKPLRDGKAMVLELKDLDQVFEQGTVRADGVNIWNEFELKDPQTGVWGGISDLCALDDTLFILSYGKNKNKEGKKKVGNLWAYSVDKDTLELMESLKGLKPEGITYNTRNQEFLITFDRGSEEPSHIMTMKRL